MFCSLCDFVLIVVLQSINIIHSHLQYVFKEMLSDLFLVVNISHAPHRKPLFQCILLSVIRADKPCEEDLLHSLTRLPFPSFL